MKTPLIADNDYLGHIVAFLKSSTLTTTNNEN